MRGFYSFYFDISFIHKINIIIIYRNIQMSIVDTLILIKKNFQILVLESISIETI